MLGACDFVRIKFLTKLYILIRNHTPITKFLSTDNPYPFYFMMLLLYAISMAFLFQLNHNFIQPIIIFEKGIIPDEPDKKIKAYGKRNFIHFKDIENITIYYIKGNINFKLNLKDGTQIYSRIGRLNDLNVILNFITFQ